MTRHWQVRPEGTCPACRYLRSSENHWILCVRQPQRPRSAAEIARLAALSVWGDTSAEQWDRRARLLENLHERHSGKMTRR